MKKRIFLLVCLLMCLFGMKALAELEKADWKRIDPNLPVGLKLVGEPQISDGKLHIVIDTYATDWDMVATAARVSNTLVIHPGIHAPEDAQGYAKRTDYYRENNETLQEAEQRIADWFSNSVKDGDAAQADFACSYQGWEIGRFDEGTGLFLPKETSSQWGQGFAVCWKMEDGTLRSERVRISVSYSDLQPVYVKRKKIADGDIVPNVKWSDATPPNVTIEEKDDGHIVYSMSNEIAVREVFTAVTMPDWADEAYLLSNGKEERIHNISYQGQFVSGKRSAVLHFNAEKQDCLYKKDWAIKWVNTTTGEFDVYALEAEFYVGTPKLTVTYNRTEMVDGKQVTITGATPMPEGRMTWSFENPLNGLDAAYNDDVFHLTVDENKLPPNRKIDLSQTNLVVQVKAPAGAAYCTVSIHKGDVIYGNNGEGARKMGTIPVTPGEFFTVPELTRGYFMPCYYTLHNGKRICYYAPKSAVGQHGGETVVFEWLKADKTPISEKSREFIAFQSDGYNLPVRQNQSLDENIKDTVEGPMVVAIDAADKNMNIEAAVVPQVGDDIVRYDVVLYDDTTGEKADPGHPVLLYLPYPDGKSAEEIAGYEFVVYHPRKNGTYEEFSVANRNLTRTEYGLCMKVTSFSPYYLSWEPASDASALPETGDDSAIWLCVMMLAASTAGMITMKKKKTAA